MTLEELYQKFDKDVQKRSRTMRLLLAIDQFFNVLIWNGSQDETISSHMYRRIEKGKALWIEKITCNLLQKLETSHCYKSRGE